MELSAKIQADSGCITYWFTNEDHARRNVKDWTSADLTELRESLALALRITEDEMEDRELLGRITRRRMDTDSVQM